MHYIDIVVSSFPYEERQRVYCMHLGDDIEDDIVKAGFRVPKVV